MEGFRRPESIVLPDNACVPGPNVVVPAPNQFTHEATRALPYFYAGAQAGTSPDGEFRAGTRVVLFRHDGGPHCRVVDGQGLYVEVEYDGLKTL